MNCSKTLQGRSTWDFLNFSKLDKLVEMTHLMKRARIPVFIISWLSLTSYMWILTGCWSVVLCWGALCSFRAVTSLTTSVLLDQLCLQEHSLQQPMSQMATKPPPPRPYLLHILVYGCDSGTSWDSSLQLSNHRFPLVLGPSFILFKIPGLIFYLWTTQLSCLEYRNKVPQMLSWALAYT